MISEKVTKFYGKVRNTGTAAGVTIPIDIVKFNNIENGDTLVLEIISIKKQINLEKIQSKTQAVQPNAKRSR